MMRALYLIVITLFATTACYGTVGEKEIIGKYVSNEKDVVNTLEVRADGTYMQHYRTASGREFENRNRWTFENADGGSAITFDEFVIGSPKYGYGGEGFWYVTVEKSFGRIRLCIDRDLGHYYVKQDAVEDNRF